MSTIHDSRYEQLIGRLKAAREEQGLTQNDLAKKLGIGQSDVSKVENREKRLDIVELFDWLSALEYESKQFFQDIGWFPEDDNNGRAVIAVPIPGEVEETDAGVLQHLQWEGQIKKVVLEGITAEQYRQIEEQIANIFSRLNKIPPPEKNREAICRALELAVRTLPDLNPSDIYQHLVYRLYIREYNRSTPEQSWVRAGGEAIELFVANHYAPVLRDHDIQIRALISGYEKKAALKEMGLDADVGSAKLDVALYGMHGAKPTIFGGIHCKASLAERVSDDIPCSRAMMKKGLPSFLWTFDSKSFPPPHGDLVNRGELGTQDQRSDKRRYIEDHGDFDACFSYNLRSTPSETPTSSGNQIYVSSLREEEDPFPNHVVNAWKRFRRNL